MLGSHSLCSHWQSSCMVEDRLGIFVFQCLPPWEPKASVTPGSGHNTWIFLSPSLVSIKNIYCLNLPAKLIYFTFFLSYKTIKSEDLIHVCLLCKLSQKGSKLYCSCQVLVVRDIQPNAPLGIPTTPAGK